MTKKSSWSKYEISYIYDTPIEYKGLKLLPVTMRDYLQFFHLSQCLTLDKNSSRDPKVISMTYLEYMYDAFISIDKDDIPAYVFFDALLKLVLKDDKLEVQYGRNEKGKAVFVIGGKEYNEYENCNNLGN